MTAPLQAGMVYCLNERMALHATIGFRTHSDTSGSSDSEFSVGGDMWYYLRTEEQLSTLAGGGIAFGSAGHPDGTTTSLIALRGYFGAEYAFSQHFAWSVRTGLGVVLGSLSGKSSTDIFLSATTGLTWFI